MAFTHQSKCPFHPNLFVPLTRLSTRIRKIMCRLLCNHVHP